MVWIIAMSLRSLVRGDTDTALGVIAALALVGWADEVVRGVNPGRRFLGAVVQGGLIVRVSMIAWSCADQQRTKPAAVGFAGVERICRLSGSTGSGCRARGAEVLGLA